MTNQTITGWPDIFATDPSVWAAILGNALTPNDPKVVPLLKLASDALNNPSHPYYDFAHDLVHEILLRRAKYRTWLTIKQREWQTKVSKRPSKANHHDSISIRERYVRC